MHIRFDSHRSNMLGSQWLAVNSLGSSRTRARCFNYEKDALYRRKKQETFTVHNNRTCTRLVFFVKISFRFCPPKHLTQNYVRKISCMEDSDERQDSDV